MIEEGALGSAESIFAMHVTPSLPVGVVESKEGPMLAGSGRFEAMIKAEGGHAAFPHLTADPILATSAVILSLQHLVSREANPLDSEVY